MHGLVIPTRGDHDQQLDQTITTADLPAHLVIITTNNPDYRRTGCTLIYDLEPINIHRWWNLGLDVLTRLGCQYATVLNDDSHLPAEALTLMREALERDGTTISHPGHPGENPGHAWTLNLHHGIRPSQTYRWWYGDNQLYTDAHTEGHGITAIPELHIPNLHHNHSTANNTELQALAEQDKQLWRALHA